MMQQLNKFKKDDMNKKIIIHQPMKEPISLNPEISTKLEASKQVLLIKNKPIQQENLQYQQQNNLDYSFEKYMMQNLNFSFVNICIEPKIEKYRQKLQQEQESQSKQELNFRVKTISENKQYSIPNFPAMPLKLQKLKMETVNNKQNQICENNKLLFDETTDEENQMKSSIMDLQFNLLKKDQIPLFQLLILIGKEQVNDKQVLWQDQIQIKNNPNSYYNKLDCDQIGINDIKVELSQNIMKDCKVNQETSSKQTIQTKQFMLQFKQNILYGYENNINILQQIKEFESRRFLIKN